MRLLNLGQMASAIKQNKIGKGEFIFYCAIFVSLVFGTLLVYVGFWEPYTFTKPWLKMLDALLTLGFECASLLLAYYINKKGDGKRFWYRIISLSVPISVLTFLISFGAGLVFGIYDVAHGVTSTLYVFGARDFLLELLLGVLGLYWVGKYMHKIAQ